MQGWKLLKIVFWMISNMFKKTPQISHPHVLSQKPGRCFFISHTQSFMTPVETTFYNSPESAYFSSNCTAITSVQAPSLLTSYLSTCCSNWGSQFSSISITLELVRNMESQVPPKPLYYLHVDKIPRWLTCMMHFENTDISSYLQLYSSPFHSEHQSQSDHYRMQIWSPHYLAKTLPLLLLAFWLKE